ncbi:hypothetical protein F2Q68_00039295 [Brassica cretica]|uniref:Uncharacterized protein n=2 Tax=Brassica cretica TaxID=69181 RepID=A0A8S9MH91_BRACR|nr:hypothetical protein F2Q68_00039295 [Brassica cretica]KAF3494992.1 hypothetical protein DY000_02052924 [Brassica cretica]
MFSFPMPPADISQHPVAEVMPVLLKGEQSTPSNFEDGRTGSTTQQARPSAELNLSSLADGRVGSTMRPARPSADLNPSSTAEGRAGSTTRSARPSAELDQSRLADGRAGSTTQPALSSAICRAGPVQFGGWSSWNGHAVLFSPLKLLPRNSIKLALILLVRMRRWNFTTLKSQELVFSYEVRIYRMKR